MTRILLRIFGKLTEHHGKCGSEMRVLITGNLGYVGSVLVPFLAKTHTDWKLFGIDTGYFGHCLLPKQPIPERYLEIQRINDIRNVTINELKEIDVVVHLASLSNDPLGNRFDSLTQAINVDAGIKLAKFAKSTGVRRFILASSCSVYGRGFVRERKEDDELDPLTSYARSKVVLEGMLNEIADENFSVIALRFATACGFSPRLRIDLVLNDFVINAVLNKRIQVLSDGSPWRPLIHVNDMSRAIDWAIEADLETPYLIMNVGSKEWTFRVSELAQLVSQVVPGTKIEINSSAGQDPRSYRVDFSKFEKFAPLHQPIMKLHESVLQLAASIRDVTLEGLDSISHLRRLDEVLRLSSSKSLDPELNWI